MPFPIPFHSIDQIKIKMFLSFEKHVDQGVYVQNNIIIEIVSVGELEQLLQMLLGGLEIVAKISEFGGSHELLVVHVLQGKLTADDLESSQLEITLEFRLVVAVWRVVKTDEVVLLTADLGKTGGFVAHFRGFRGF